MRRSTRLILSTRNKYKNLVLLLRIKKIRKKRRRRKKKRKRREVRRLLQKQLMEIVRKKMLRSLKPNKKNHN